MASKTLEDNLYLVEENNAQIARWSYKTVKISSENVCDRRDTKNMQKQYIP